MSFEQNNAFMVPMTMCSAHVEIDLCTPGWELTELPAGDPLEERVFRMPIEFDAPFANTPIVHVGISGFDIDNGDTARLSTRVEEVSATGFVLVIATWLYTLVYRVEVNWIALGHQATN